MADYNTIIKNSVAEVFPEIGTAFDLNEWIDDVEIRGLRVEKFRQYTEGEHDAKLTKQMRKLLRIKLETEKGAKLDEMNISYMELIVQAMADRIKVNALIIEPESDDEEDRVRLQEWITGVMRDNNFNEIQAEVHEGAVRDGNSFVMVSPEYDETESYSGVLWTSEPAYDTSNGVIPYYDGQGNLLFMVKLWALTAVEPNEETGKMSFNTVVRVNIYVDDYIYRFITTKGSNAIEPLAKDPTITTNIALPFGACKNKQTNYSHQGRSEIRIAIPAQNVLNRIMHSTAHMSEMSSWKLRLAKGFNPDGEFLPGQIFAVYFTTTDEDGNEMISYDTTEEQNNFLKAVDLIELGGDNLDTHIRQAEWLATTISQITRTPAPEFMARDNTSGESLKQREVGLIGKILRFQNANSDMWKRVVNLSWEVENEIGKQGLPAIKYVDVAWQDPQIREDIEFARILIEMYRDTIGVWPDKFYREQLAMALGIDQAQLLRAQRDLEKQQKEAEEVQDDDNEDPTDENVEEDQEENPQEIASEETEAV